MERHVAKLFSACDSGKMNRRQLLQALGLSATAAFAGSAVPAFAAAFGSRAAQAGAGGGRTFPVTAINHLAYASSNWAKTRDFYVDLFGMRVAWDDGKGCALEFGDMKAPNGMFIRPAAAGAKPIVGHIAFGYPDMKNQVTAMKAELDRRGARPRPDTEIGWSCDDPNGYMLNIVVVKDPTMFPGASPLCKKITDPTCKEGYEAGLKNLANAPKPSGSGFKAYAFSHVVLNCADLQKGREFYENFLGMKAIYNQPADPAKKKNAQVLLRFGQNTLYLRPSNQPDGKPYCNHFAFVVEDYDQAKVEAELKRRGLDPQPDSRLAWTIRDPDGMRIEVAGWGLPEHIANDCQGAAPRCPGGARG